MATKGQEDLATSPIWQPPYSPNFAIVDFFLLQRVKSDSELADLSLFQGSLKMSLYGVV
jgi:hypothetical protein